MEWTPKRGNMQKSAGKVIASIFRDMHSIIFIDSLNKGNTINSYYYVALLENLKKLIAKKCRHLKKKMQFHQDNPP